MKQKTINVAGVYDTEVETEDMTSFTLIFSSDKHKLKLKLDAWMMEYLAKRLWEAQLKFETRCADGRRALEGKG